MKYFVDLSPSFTKKELKNNARERALFFSFFHPSDWISPSHDAGHSVRFALEPFIYPRQSLRGQQFPFDGAPTSVRMHGVQFNAPEFFRREHALVLLDGRVERVDGVEEHALVEGFVFEVFVVEFVFGGVEARGVRGRGGVDASKDASSSKRRRRCSSAISNR